MQELIEEQIRPTLVRWTLGSAEFEAMFQAPALAEPGLVAHENEWLLWQWTYHTHREGRSVQRTRAQQRPRRRRVGYFPSLEACRTKIWELVQDGAGGACP